MPTIFFTKHFCHVAATLILLLCSMGLNSCTKHRESTSSSSQSADKNRDLEQLERIHNSNFDTINVALFPAEDALPMLYANEWGLLDSLGIKANFFIYRSQMDAEQAISQGKANVGMSDMFRIVWLQNQKKAVGWLFSTKRQLFFVPNKNLRLSKISQIGDHMIASSRFSMDDYYLSNILKGNTEKKKADGTLSSAPIHVQVNSLPLRLSMLLSHQVDGAVFNAFQAREANDKGYKALSIKDNIAEGFGGYACNTSWAADHIKQLRRVLIAYDIAVDRLASMDSLPQLSNTTKILTPNNRQSYSIGRVKHAPVSEVLNWLRRQNAISSNYHPDTLIVDLP